MYSNIIFGSMGIDSAFILYTFNADMIPMDLFVNIYQMLRVWPKFNPHCSSRHVIYRFPDVLDFSYTDFNLIDLVIFFQKKILLNLHFE